MKPLTILLAIGIFVTNVVTTYAQTATPLKKGIYRTFEEFRNNAPSIELRYDITSVEKNTGGVVKGTQTIFYALDTHKYTAQKIGRVYGFCDGKNVYINEYRPKLKASTLFMKVQKVGNYSVFEYKTTAGMLALKSKNRVVDMITGKIKVVTRKYLERLFNDTRIVATAIPFPAVASLGK